MWFRRDLASAGLEQREADEPQSQQTAVLILPARAAQIPTDQCNLLGLLMFWWRFQGIGCLTVSAETLVCCCAAPRCVRVCSRWQQQQRQAPAAAPGQLQSA